MGTTRQDAAGEKEKEKETDVEEIKKGLHQHARKIVSGFQRHFDILNEICRDAEFWILSVNASFPASSLR